MEKLKKAISIVLSIILLEVPQLYSVDAIELKLNKQIEINI